MATKSDTLLVRHLPQDLTDDDKHDFFRHFGAVSIRCMSCRGKLKNCAFVTFPDESTAGQALLRLHQLDLLDRKLTAEYSKKCYKQYHPSILDVNSKCKDKEENEPIKLIDTTLHPPANINIASKWGIPYPVNPALKYMYPPADENIIVNITHALVAVPKFYVQVLHLMNKMNLPAPFGPVTLAPPLPLGKHPDTLQPPEPDITEQEEMDFSETEESEIESDTEGAKLQPKIKRQKNPVGLSKKKHKLQHIVSAPKSQANLTETTEMFEATVDEVAPKKIAIKLSDNPIAENIEQQNNVVKDAADISVTVGGFGTIEPCKKDEQEQEVKEESWDTNKFISDLELKQGRLSKEQMKDFSVFKKYAAGEATTRLYLKNLAKAITEKDLHYIYGRYIDWSSEIEQNMFDVRVMKEGRMKGQGFVTLASEKAAQKACKDTNAYVLQGKPMVVQFARSAKPKEQKT